MTADQLVKVRKEILEKRKAFTDEQDKEWSKVLREYEAATSPFKLGQVIEIPKAKKFKRMAIYSFRTLFFTRDSPPALLLHGWYLDNENKPVKWEGNGLFVSGVGNLTPYTLSEDQTHVPAKGMMS